MIQINDNGVWPEREVEALAQAGPAEILEALSARIEDPLAQPLNPYELRPLLSSLLVGASAEAVAEATNVLAEAHAMGLDVEDERADISLLREDVEALRELPPDVRAAAVARLNEGPLLTLSIAEWAALEYKLGPGERFVGGQRLYSAAWLGVPS